MNAHVSKHKLFPHKNTAERWAQEMLSQWQQGRVGLVLDAKRVYYAHKHAVYEQVHTSAPWVIKEVISIQNTTGIALIPCSPCSINNCSVLFNLRKQAGAMKRGRLLKGWRLTGTTAQFLHSLNFYISTLSLLPMFRFLDVFAHEHIVCFEQRGIGHYLSFKC